MKDCFQIIDENNNIETCRHCNCCDFIIGKTLKTGIFCGKCGKFHKNISQQAISQAALVEVAKDHRQYKDG
jgi:anaerobic ribonucleoside-triphosphate reductase